MDEQVRTELIALLRTGGRNLCTMPLMVGILLRERCPNADGPVADIERAQSCGCVQPIVDAVGPVDKHELAETLAEQSGMAPECARWVIESWAMAIDAADSPPALRHDWSAWNQLAVKHGETRSRSFADLIVVTIVGALGGIVPCCFVVLTGSAQMMGWRPEEGQDAPTPAELAAWFVLGLLGGATGSLFGWIIANSGRWAGNAAGMQSSRLIVGIVGAGLGALIGTIIGLNLFGLIGVMFGGMVGAFCVELLGLMSAETLSRLWR